MDQKILKTHKNKAPKGVANLRRTHTKYENSSSKKKQKNRINKNEKNRKWITRRPEPGHFLGHGEG